jgi:hypothetical protein
VRLRAVCSEVSSASVLSTFQLPSCLFGKKKKKLFFSPFSRKNAEDALQGLNGITIGKQAVRLSWGRNPANKQVRPCSELHSTSKHTVKLWRAETLTLFCRLLMQFRGDNGNMQWKNGGVYYAAPPFYNGGYGYPAAAPFPDPGMYAAPAYGAYPFYGNQQQVS